MEEDKILTLNQSCVIANGRLYEQVRGNKFVTIIYDAHYKKSNHILEGKEGNWDKKYKIEFLNKIYKDKETVIYPNYGDELKENHEVVILPTCPKHYGTLKELVEEIKEFIHKWLDVSSDFQTFAAWYIPLSWVYDSVPTINYLSTMGDTGVGKSRFLNVVGKLCYKPIIGSGGVSVAAVKRLINKWRGTLLIDEGDFKISDETADLIKLLNLGFEKGNAIFNCDKNDPSQIEFFDPYCPKVITRRRQFGDQALEARCLTETMQQTNRKDIPPLLTQVFHKKQMELRDKLLAFRFDYWDKIDIDKATNFDFGDIEPRIKQAVLAFTTLISNCPDALEDFKVFIQKYNKSIINERAISFDGLIVNIITDLICQGQEYITSTDISEELTKQNYKANPNTIGRHLNQLKIGVVAKKIEGKTRKIISLDSLLLDVIKRYCTDESKVTAVTVVTTHTSTPSIRNFPQKSLNNNKIHVDVSVVTSVTSVTQLLKIFFENDTKIYHIDELFERVNDDEKLTEYLNTLKTNGYIMEVRPNEYKYCGV